MSSRPSSRTSARIPGPGSSSKSHQRSSASPRPTDTWLATSQGLRRGSGVSMVPTRMRSVRVAAAASAIQAAIPHTPSQTKKASQPCSSATTARSPAVRAFPYRSIQP
jgi:hypothetical protein